VDGKTAEFKYYGNHGSIGANWVEVAVGLASIESKKDGSDVSTAHFMATDNVPENWIKQNFTTLDEDKYTKWT
jgi:hypothetical protein